MTNRVRDFAKSSILIICISAGFLYGLVNGDGCAARNYGPNKVVCVCNATYCDSLNPPEKSLQQGYYLQYTSTQDGKRLLPSSLSMKKSDTSGASVWKLDDSRQYQTMHGFGGALTDSVGINLGTISKSARENLLKEYYGPNGIGYSFLRIAMGGTDFSTRFYTYDDGPTDITLSRFSLAEEDYKYKLPYLKFIKQLSDPKIVTAPWSPPAWMIEPRNGSVGYTRLRDKFYQVHAEYFINFLQAYKMEGIDIWALSTQNEPGDGYYVYFGINSCGYSPEEERTFIVNNLAPTLHKNGFGNITILNCEDQRTELPDWPEHILGDSAAYNYIGGTSVHWYFDDLYPASRLTALHDKYPEKFILYTEASYIPDPDEPAVLFGDWTRAEKLSHDMIEVFNHWATGWIDWNLALDTVGGPTYLRNYLDSAMIVNATANEFYKQPIFYSMAHFSKFVPPGSRRIDLAPPSDTDVESVAFMRPDNIVAVILLNRKDEDRNIVLNTQKGNYMPISVPARSLNSVIFYDS